MKCIADLETKDCCCQDSCCIECKNEDCHEGCKLDEKGCKCCEYAIETVFDIIKRYDLNTMAIYLHSWQAENYTVEEIKELLNTENK